MIKIKHGLKKFDVRFDIKQYGDYWTSHYTLRDLVLECSRISGVDPNCIKLMLTGGNQNSDLSFWKWLTNNDSSSNSGSHVLMKDHSKTLESYRIYDGCRVMMLGENNYNINTEPQHTQRSSSYSTTPPKSREQTRPLPPPQKPQHYPETSSVQLKTPLETQLEKLDSILQSSITNYSQTHPTIISQLASLEIDKVNLKKTNDMALKLGEGLMQDLLKVDGVVLENPEVDDPGFVLRGKRKEVVKTIQGMLDVIDRVKAEVKALLSIPLN